MSSTILYKFRSGTTFEALPLPGSAARLFDVKKAIVIAKKLDQGSMDFELSVKDAASGVDYTDDTTILPRGTRLVVQRLPAARGQGILAKISRSQYGGAPAMNTNASAAANHGAPSDFYTIDGRAHDEDEEFVSSATTVANNEENELAALRAATESAAQAAGGPLGAIARGGGGSYRPAGSGPPPQARGTAMSQQLLSKHNNNAMRPNADPELREQESQPKKRATGIPRTFLSLSAPQTADGSDGGGGGGVMSILQPNSIGFEELVNRGGGQSENAAGTKRDLDYAIKLTAATIPEYLQCAICQGVVRDAMMLPWDPEGRTTCETCIRNALTESGFRCPLTQQEGISPDDLLPNHALRKAAIQFINDVMEKVAEIDRQAAIEEKIENELDRKSNMLEGGLNDKGVVLTRRVSAAEQRRQEEEDPFGGGDDDFGGDVFAVHVVKADVVEKADIADTDTLATTTMKTEDAKSDEDLPQIKQEPPETLSIATPAVKEEPIESSVIPAAVASDPAVVKSESLPEATTNTPVNQQQGAPSRRETNRRRGPPVGYTMGPASGSATSALVAPSQPIAEQPETGNPPQAEARGEQFTENRERLPRESPSGHFTHGRGRGFGGRYGPNATHRGGRGNHFPEPHTYYDAQNSEYGQRSSTKRARSDGNANNDESGGLDRFIREDHGGRGEQWDHRREVRGRGPGRGGPQRGRGSWDETGGRGFRGGRFNGFRGGRGGLY